ncbi:MAG: hypothetical protein VB050_04945 [Geobacteraceae bacterium]|nr:hypothetical protein [Geobacteraceae bacterium]
MRTKTIRGQHRHRLNSIPGMVFIRHYRDRFEINSYSTLGMDRVLFVPEAIN